MILYKKVGFDEIDAVKPLWNKLSAYHKTVSEYFSEDFEKDTYGTRKEIISKKEYVQIILAYEGETMIGYIIASMDKKQGEIESLFVDESYRGLEIGDRLMTLSREWIKRFKPESIKVSVAYGNQVISFYEKHGFLPRSIILKDNVIAI
ncbi:MAG: GNAT family N-acetyltransferase [Clostridia bacterium]|nr:GNAT family N-acetyltransferase [Clostridia bacterium]